MDKGFRRSNALVKKWRKITSQRYIEINAENVEVTFWDNNYHADWGILRDDIQKITFPCSRITAIKGGCQEVNEEKKEKGSKQIKHMLRVIQDADKQAVKHQKKLQNKHCEQQK